MFRPQIGDFVHCTGFPPSNVLSLTISGTTLAKSDCSNVDIGREQDSLLLAFRSINRGNADILSNPVKPIVCNSVVSHTIIVS